MNPAYDLERFVTAQDALWPAVQRELAAGAKRSHWMWFVFPQIAGLGHSATSRHYALASLTEAQAYLADPLLGARLRECTDLVLAVQGRSAHAIFGSPDDMKFRSSMTLFAQAAPGERRFAEAIERFFAGVPDAATLRLLAGGAA
ncbi:DUF1810 domain-containing protein [Aureimonas pseudogalii]|uniref:Uncharacterized protein (DUF1810 family) n=1 Tax=Aureimonas pseudogalii TaxID=1744844 RepID=A0A7W6H2W7_9HYPH|nr:DUF1810 domain-containing protein [Aureimonas pseudogalii]MBB3997100.1 uncharacterized protein (DUF1810 family) [Aureimonas pseudogalii]